MPMFFKIVLTTVLLVEIIRLRGDMEWQYRAMGRPPFLKRCMSCCCASCIVHEYFYGNVACASSGSVTDFWVRSEISFSEVLLF